ncbi:Battenin [Halotydeus destructor]|nr:Battenin [Halotydeus destructor]
MSQLDSPRRTSETTKKRTPSNTLSSVGETSVYSIEQDYFDLVHSSGSTNRSLDPVDGDEERITSGKLREGQKTINGGDKKEEKMAESRKAIRRNFIGFWLLGLCNNYAYVIMLSAAMDILSKEYNEGDIPAKPDNVTEICNPTSTAAVLLADVLPSLITKLLAPFFFTNTQMRVILVVGLCTASFLITSFSTSVLMSFTGIVCASISSGLGEVTFLSYMSKFDRSTISGWSSGTGAAGLVGAGAYAMCTFYLSPRTTLLLMLVIPVILSSTYWFLIIHPSSSRLEAVATRPLIVNTGNSYSGSPFDENSVQSSTSLVGRELTFREKIKCTKALLPRFMLPLGMVYFFEYFINQGFFELVYFPDAFIEHKSQYRIYNLVYQLGVFISRSSLSFFEINKLWTLPILQGANWVLFLLHIMTPFFPNIWVVFAVVLYEGLLGGGAYVNTFNTIAKESLPQHKEFNMGIASLADSMGIVLAALLSMPTHRALCRRIESRS